MKKKLMSALIAIIMLLSMIPSVALAETDASEQAETTDLKQVVYEGGTRYYNGAGAQVEANQLGDKGSVVKVSKTIAPTDTENLFDITLEVVTTQAVERMEKNAAVVLVIDASNSMTMYGRTRLEDAKAAAQAFIDNFMRVSKSTTQRYVSVVSFNKTAAIRSDWKDVARNTSAATEIKNDIEDLSSDGGTNIYEGISVAKDLLNSNTIANIENKYLIFLSDGQPSQGQKIHSSNATGKHCCHVEAEAAAKSITGVAKYAIYLGNSGDQIECDGSGVINCPLDDDSISVTQWLGTGSGNRLNFENVLTTDDSTQLSKIYEEIFEEMGLESKAWQVADPAGSNIVFAESNNNSAVDLTADKIEWDLSVETSQPSEGVQYTTYTYTYTYKAKLNTLNTDYVAGEDYNTNGETYLTYVIRDAEGFILDASGNRITDGDGNPVKDITDASEPSVKAYLRKANFTIPQVEGFDGEFSFYKVDSTTGAGLGGATFTLSHVKSACDNCILPDEEWTEDSQADGKVEFTHIPSGHKYVLTESKAPSGYAASGESYTVSVDYGVVTIEGVNDIENFTVQNTEDPYIDINVKKEWITGNDNNHRNFNVTAKLLANGVDTGQSITLNRYSDWKGTFSNLPKKDDASGIPYNYTIEESFRDDNNDYTSRIVRNSETSFTIYNVLNGRTLITVTKKWEDNNDQDGIRPQTVYAQLQRSNNKGEYENSGDPVPLTADNGWTHAWTNLSSNRRYRVVESKTPYGYTSVVSGDAETGFTITNTLKTIDISGKKEWDDEDNQDGIRPDSITVNLLADGKEVKSRTVTAADGWAWTFEDLPEFANGEEIVYTISEDPVTGYTSNVDGFTITNTLKTTDITVTKEWDDEDNQDGIRPESITVRLLANGQEVASKVVTANDNWEWTFKDLPEFANGEEIDYTISEDAVEGYTTTVTGDAADGFIITNTKVINISGSKTWDDAENQDGIRPESITIKLFADGEATEKTATATAENGWKWEFTNLPKYKNGEEIKYTVSEDAVEGYTTEVSGYNVTNTHTPAKTKVTVTKVWNDANNQDGIRPASIQVQLKADGNNYGDSVTLNAGNQWSHTWENLPKKAAGADIVYTVAEISEVEGYTTVYGGNAQEGFTITNKHTPETINISGTKSWDDDDNRDGKRPAEITVKLFEDGIYNGKTATANAASDWKYTFKDLPKYKNGVAIVYTITEESVLGYDAHITGYDVTNIHPVETVNVSGRKVWDDNNNQDGIRPESVTVRLLKNGNQFDSVAVTPDSSGNWNYSFVDLPKYEAGKEILYTIEEDAVEGYTTAVDGYNVTNTHTPETTEVEGSKTWEDADDQDGMRPESITVHLFADGEKIDSATVTADDSWEWSFSGLPKYKEGEQGVAIVYTITEDPVANYTTKIDGYDITNTHTPATVEVSGRKTWVDNNNQDGKRPGSITINLLADEEATDKTATVTAADNWAWSFTGLPKFRDGGIEIVYTITEDPVANYTTEIDGYDITNTHVPETVEVSGIKTWNDNNNQDGKRPESITINLLADGKEVKSMTVTEADGWEWEFTNLPKYAGGREITYTINEVSIDDYTTRFDGYNVTNTHNPGMTSVTVHKVWNDEGDQDGKRPASIQVQLKAGEENCGDPITLNEDNQWRHTWENLPKKAAGADIVYTVAEISEVKGYTTTVTGDAASGFTVTNSYTPETIDISGTKSWNDDDNRDGKRPASITINLLADGKEINSVTVEADANNEEAGKNNEWPWSFTKLPKFRDGGIAIVYTITEDAVEDYTTAIDGYNVTNSHTPETINISGSKTWADGENQDGKRPESITVRLLADGTEVKEATVTAEDNWEYAFEDLPKYEAGKEILYTIEEDEVEGYTTAVNGYNVTNTHTPETTSVSVSKVWDDADDQDGFRPAGIIIRLFDGEKQVDIQRITADADGNWKHTFLDLPKYRDGKEIVYTITEDTIAGYDTEITGSADKGYTVTNSYTPQVVSVSGSKTWDDAYNQDGLRPESITVRLLADGKEVKSMTVTEADGWAWRFTDLPKFASGKLISYTVTEDEVEGYNAKVNGYSITNTHEPETISVSGSKTWDDGDNYAGKRPESITVNLYADEEKVCSKVVTEEDGWAWSFADLPKYKEGEVGVEIKYAVTEEGIEGYKATVDGFDITNSYRNGKLIINKVISGKRAKADDEFTLKLTLKAANALQPAALNNSIFAAVLANVDGAENIVFTRYNSAGEIVASEHKVYYPSQVNEYEFKLKGGEKMIVTQLPDELLKYTVTETVKLGYIDTYSNCEGETYIFGDPVEATVKNHKGGSSNNIVPPPQFGPPKTGDASVLGYSIMAVMAALGVMGSRRKK